MITLITSSGKKVPIVTQWYTNKKGKGKVVLCPIDAAESHKSWELKFDSESDADELCTYLDEMAGEMTKRVDSFASLRKEIRDLSDSALVALAKMLNKEVSRRSGGIISNLSGREVKTEEKKTTEVTP